jgi:hypothetical protein
MQPDVPKDSALLGLLNTALKQATDATETIRKSQEETKNRLYIAEEKIRSMGEDQSEIKIELRDRSRILGDRIDILEKNILDDQKKRSNAIIAIQSTILLLTIGSLITYLFLFLPRP